MPDHNSSQPEPLPLCDAGESSAPPYPSSEDRGPTRSPIYDRTVPTGSASVEYAGWHRDAGRNFPRRCNPAGGRSTVVGAGAGQVANGRCCPPNWQLNRCLGDWEAVGGTGTAGVPVWLD